ncbi:hypothetical protein L9F63_004013, partial [Diploptera punctata]
LKTTHEEARSSLWRNIKNKMCTLIKMDYQFSFKQEENLSGTEIEPQDMKVEIKSEIEDLVCSVDIKCETLSAVDTLASQETKFETAVSELISIISSLSSNGVMSPGNSSLEEKKDM